MHLHQAYGHAGRVFGLAFHPIWGPNILASASEDESVRVWCRTRPTDDWEQTSCCRGHQAEVLRVAWSPDGRILASGSADHTVRLWQVGTQGQSSYSGTELAVLKDHPGEVYGLKFLNLPTVVTQQVPPQPAAAAATAVDQQQQQQHDTTQDTPQQVAAANQQIQQQQQLVQYDTLLTASGESLFLWDLTSGKIIHRSAPLPVMSMLRKLQLSSSSSSSRPQSSGISIPTIGAGFAAGALDPKPQQQQQQQDVESDPAAAAAGDNDDEEEEEDAVPSYVFSVAAADATNWLAAVCSDGMMRLWDASKRSLQEMAAVKVHPSDMGSAVSFVPQQPWLILALSKRGETVLQDIRMMGQPLLKQQLEGPVYDMAWTVTDVLDSGSNGVDAAAAGGCVSELMLNVVGCDEYIRRYPFNRAALQAGQLCDPELMSVGSDYTGRLLTLAATLDGKTLAAAGDAIPADQIRPQKPRTIIHQPQQQQLQQEQGNSRAVNGSAAVGDQPTAAAAAAKRAAAAAGCHSRRRRVAVDLFDMEDDDQKGPSSPQQQQQPPTQSSNPAAEAQQDAQPAAAAAPGNNSGNEIINAVTTTVDGVDYSSAVEEFAASVGVKVSDMPPEWAQMVAAAAASGMLGGGGDEGGGGGGGCAAASGVLTRAPLFTMQTGRLEGGKS